jgi:pilus assembly protein Flp/PilA
MNNNYGEQGQGLVEYALIMLLVAIAVIIALALLGPSVGNLYSDIVQGI